MRSVLEKQIVRRTNRLIRVLRLMCLLSIFCVCAFPIVCCSGWCTCSLRLIQQPVVYLQPAGKYQRPAW
jgi:hypothetical protein